MWLILCAMPHIQLSVYTPEQVQGAVEAFARIYDLRILSKDYDPGGFNWNSRDPECYTYILDNGEGEKLTVTATYIGTMPNMSP